MHLILEAIMDFKPIFDELRALQDARQGSRIKVVINVNVLTRLSALGVQPISPLSGDATEIWRTDGKAMRPL